MLIPFLVIGAVAAAAGLGMTGHSGLKQCKWKKVHDERLAKLQAVQEEAEGIHNQMKVAGESLGRAKVQAFHDPTLRRKSELVSHFSLYSMLRLRPWVPANANTIIPNPATAAPSRNTSRNASTKA